MTDHNRDLTGPTEAKAVDRPALRTDLDPIAIVTELVGDDPSVAELVAFRNAMPDLKFAARESKRLADEAMRLRNHTEALDAVRSVVAGLTLVGLRLQSARRDLAVGRSGRRRRQARPRRRLPARISAREGLCPLALARARHAHPHQAGGVPRGRAGRAGWARHAVCFGPRPRDLAAGALRPDKPAAAARWPADVRRGAARGLGRADREGS